MVDSVGFGLASLRSEIAAARQRHDEVRAGMGARFFAVFRASFDELHSELLNLEIAINSAAPDDAKASSNYERSVHRLLERLRVHDTMVAEYAADVGRDDLPSGYLMLIDQICDALIEGPADPIVHVANAWDYSVSNVGNGIILHLPAVDPSNALLAPILVHELAHLLFNDSAEEFNRRRATMQGELDIIDGLAVDGTTNDEEALREALLPKWAEELFCDAIATLVAGPSYLAALCSRVVGTYWDPDKEHPPPQMRIGLVIAVLGRHHWIPLVEHATPEVMTWAREYSEQRQSGAASLWQFLWRATETLTQQIMELAESRVRSPMKPSSSARNALMAAKHFKHRVLPVDLARSEAFEWEMILGAWLQALQESGNKVHEIPNVASNRQLNGLLVKTIELSKVAELWRTVDASR